MKDITKQMEKFIKAVNEKYNIHLFGEPARKYCRLTDGRSSFCFIDMTNGDVLKAETWRKPAKHARSNIFADDLGLSGVNQYGAVYLR